MDDFPFENCLSTFYVMLIKFHCIFCHMRYSYNISCLFSFFHPGVSGWIIATPGDGRPKFVLLFFLSCSFYFFPYLLLSSYDFIPFLALFYSCCVNLFSLQFFHIFCNNTMVFLLILCFD